MIGEVMFGDCRDSLRRMAAAGVQVGCELNTDYKPLQDQRIAASHLARESAPAADTRQMTLPAIEPVLA